MKEKELNVVSVVSVLGVHLTIYGSVERPVFLVKEVAKVIDYHKDYRGKYSSSSLVKAVPERNKFKHPFLIANKGRSFQERDVWFVDERGLYILLTRTQKRGSAIARHEIMNLLTEIRKSRLELSPREKNSNPYVCKEINLEIRAKNKKRLDLIKIIRDQIKTLDEEGEKLESEFIEWKRNNKNLVTADIIREFKKRRTDRLEIKDKLLASLDKYEWLVGF